MFKKAITIILMLVFVAGQYGVTLDAMGLSQDHGAAKACSHCNCGGEACCIDASQPDIPTTPAPPPQTTSQIKVSLLASMVASFQLTCLESRTSDHVFAPPISLNTERIPAYEMFCAYLI